MYLKQDVTAAIKSYQLKASFLSLLWSLFIQYVSPEFWPLSDKHNLETEAQG